jgi:hypothetical protein
VNPENLDFNKTFTFTAKLEYNGVASTAQFARTAVDTWAGILTEPYALQGVELAYTPLEASISFGGFAVSHGEDSDAGVVAFAMIEALESAFRKDAISVTAGKDRIEITGGAGAEFYILTLDMSGLPTSLSMPERKIKADFSDIQITGVLN